MNKPLKKTKIKQLNKDLANKISTKEIVLILQDVTDAFNVGNIFRTADATGVEEVILTNNTPTPPNEEIAKTSMGFDRRVPWQQIKDPIEAINYVHERGFQVIGLDLTENSKLPREIKLNNQLCLVLGNEQIGIHKKLISECDEFMALPMLGKGNSLNVGAATAAALYQLLL